MAENELPFNAAAHVSQPHWANRLLGIDWVRMLGNWILVVKKSANKLSFIVSNK